jgi:hypothetical protein
LKYTLSVFLLLLCISLTAQGSARLSFMQEDLNFKLSLHTFTVDGRYWFSNESDENIKQALFYPYPTDDYLGKAEFLKLKLIHPLKGQNVKKLSGSDKGFWFEVTLPAKTIMECRIAYKQKLKANKAKYIILTTNSWGRPLEQAIYTLQVPHSLKITSLSLAEPDIRHKLFHDVYRWELKNFHPDTDFIVEFQ